MNDKLAFEKYLKSDSCKLKKKTILASDLLRSVTDIQEIAYDLSHLTFDLNREVRQSFIDLGGAFETLINAIKKYLVEVKE